MSTLDLVALVFGLPCALLVRLIDTILNYTFVIITRNTFLYSLDASCASKRPSLFAQI